MPRLSLAEVFAAMSITSQRTRFLVPHAASPLQHLPPQESIGYRGCTVASCLSAYERWDVAQTLVLMPSKTAKAAYHWSFWTCVRDLVLRSPVYIKGRRISSVAESVRLSVVDQLS